MIDFRIQRSWARDGFDMWLINRMQNKSFIAKTIELQFVEIGEGEMLPEPSLRVDGMFAREMIPAMRSALAGLQWFEKEQFDMNSNVQKAMQDHINSLKQVVDAYTKSRIFIPNNS